ncbi:hypothetical protein COU17_03665 [Candidatus Kaiserbacteria bacterium CG10_big_fil_rev_8_21_14_0_10_49_17]|uniref:TraC-like domain-containing protein n=1 Tax=Candidatus Kaiserbacteria bacterium CG10_big_fil_rev_8_21_14_0_10_49_17 TaxID=1974609 RepID=A0A2M6WDK9_9BACT|nr:MAG: hypothetical protein COU17_03665 [Candidatus Kaiserbacteria bacterium CG10_big_fil_rev_8_21_14_0_10_49_17]
MAKSSQNFVPVKEVRDGIMILNDGSLRAVLMASSLNFALKSTDEQEAIISQFQNFLNSLEFSIQIFVQSRELDVRPYVALLEGQLENTFDDLMKIQINEYISFIKNFTESANIMSKNFFIIIPYSSAGFSGKDNPIRKVFGKRKDTLDVRQGKDGGFEERRSQLEQRMAVVEQGLIRTGVRVAKLETEEVIELLYKIFNPGEQEKPIPLSQMKNQHAAQPE